MAGGGTHAYLCERYLAGEAVFTCDLCLSQRAFLRISVCGCLLRITLGVPASLTLDDETACSWGCAMEIPAQFHSSSNMYIFCWGYVESSSLLYIYASLYVTSHTR